MRLIAEHDFKSDGFDAELLARLGRIDPVLLKELPLETAVAASADQ